MIGRILVIAWKEFLQVRRDRLTLAMMVAMPVMQLMLFGFAINTDVRNIPLAVSDADYSPASRDLVTRMVQTGFYDLKGYVEDPRDLKPLLRRGEVKAGLVIPPQFGARLVEGVPVSTQLLLDGSDPQTVGSATSAATGVTEAVGAVAREATYARTGRTPPPPPVQLEPQIWYNPDLRTAVFIVPGLAGVILTLTMVMFTSMAVARERERGTLEQLIVSPIRSAELIVGKILPYVLVGYIQLTLILIAGWLVFQVRTQGELTLLYGLGSVFIASSLAIGLLFSTLAQTQQQAMQMSFFFLLPNILLSGFMFPWEAMPRPIQLVSQVLPLTHFLRIVRGVVLKASTFEDLQHELVALVMVLVVFVSLAAMRFRKKLG